MSKTQSTKWGAVSGNVQESGWSFKVTKTTLYLNGHWFGTVTSDGKHPLPEKDAEFLIQTLNRGLPKPHPTNAK
jgi:hypothetical protein